MRLLDVGFVLASIIPESFKDCIMSDPDDGATMKKLDDRNHQLRAEKKNIYKEPNVGDCTATPWYTDESFGQQQFTGANPTTIEAASSQWAKEFQDEATKQGNAAFANAIADAAKSHSLSSRTASTIERPSVLVHWTIFQRALTTPPKPGSRAPRSRCLS